MPRINVRLPTFAMAMMSTNAAEMMSPNVPPKGMKKLITMSTTDAEIGETVAGRYDELVDSMAVYVDRDSLGHQLLSLRIELSDAMRPGRRGC